MRTAIGQGSTSFGKRRKWALACCLKAEIVGDESARQVLHSHLDVEKRPREAPPEKKRQRFNLCSDDVYRKIKQKRRAVEITEIRVDFTFTGRKKKV